MLRTLLTVARTGNVARAARHLSYSNSSVQYHLRELERELGVSLLTKCNGRLHPTRAGECVIESACTILEAVDELRRQLDQLDDGVQLPRDETQSFSGATEPEFTSQS
jgi:DNA-binding transcriptional LysR family regulator